MPEPPPAPRSVAGGPEGPPRPSPEQELAPDGAEPLARSTLDLVPGDIGTRALYGLAPVDLTAPIPVPDDVRLIGSDLDGTLLGSDLRVGERAVRAIPHLADVGVQIVYVTGRPPRWLLPVMAQTSHAPLAVCANGALIVDLASGRLLRSTPLTNELAGSVVRRLRELVPGISFALERLLPGAAQAVDLSALTTVGYEPAYDPPWAGMAGVERGDVLDLIGRGEPIKLLAAPPIGTGHDSDSLLALAEQEFADALHITHSGTREVLIEIMAGEVNKGLAFMEVAEYLGVAMQQTIGIGDMPNDEALIRVTGTGYAVANAHPVCRAAADHLLPSNDDDGVGRLLEAVLAAQP